MSLYFQKFSIKWVPGHRPHQGKREKSLKPFCRYMGREAECPKERSSLKYTFLEKKKKGKIPCQILSTRQNQEKLMHTYCFYRGTPFLVFVLNIHHLHSLCHLVSCPCVAFYLGNLTISYICM